MNQLAAASCVALVWSWLDERRLKVKEWEEGQKRKWTRHVMEEGMFGLCRENLPL